MVGAWPPPLPSPTLEVDLARIRAHLAATARNLELIDYKIDYYRERLAER
jgi:hypothetical protein